MSVWAALMPTKQNPRQVLAARASNHENTLKENMAKNILIDKEFQALIPPLSAEEKQQLEANIAADGCRDPLVLWRLPTFDVTAESGMVETLAYSDAEVTILDDGDGGGYEYRTWLTEDDEISEDDWPHILIDGHNRHEICTRLGLTFEVVVQEFADRDAVMDWMDANQLGRRNLTKDQFTLLIGRRYNRTKQRVGGQLPKGVDQIDPPLSTAEKLATDYGISQATVKRAGQYADAVETINSAAPGFTATVNAGEAPTRQEVVKAASVVAKIPEAAQNVALAAEFADLPSEAKQDAIEAIAQLAPAQEVMREAVKNHRAIGTGENEWYTPAEYADMAREVMGSIDLDPASCDEANKVVRASAYYTKEDDGLTKVWKGNLWVNPPYSRDLMPAFVEKLKQSFINGDVDSAILLSHNNTDTAWFHSLASVASAICFPKKRIKFYRGEEIAAPTNGQAFFYLGDNAGAFADIFGSVGFVVEPIPAEVCA